MVSIEYPYTGSGFNTCIDILIIIPLSQLDQQIADSESLCETKSVYKGWSNSHIFIFEFHTVCLALNHSGH